MNPLAIHARAFRCLDAVDTDLPDGCVAIVGANGEGKSSLLAIIDVALFGARSRSLDDYHQDDSTDDLVAELEFEHAGAVYRVRRTYSPRGRGKSTCDFECQTDGAWEPLTRGSVKETDQLICSTIGMNRATFYASSFLVQGRGGRDFADAEPSARKRVLGDVLGLDRYDHLQERARQDRRTFEADLQTLDGKTAAAREQVEQKPAIVAQRDQAVEAETELADRIADLEREHAVLAERFQEAREQGARRQAAEADLREATAELERLAQAEIRAKEAAAQFRSARDELATLPSATSTDELVERERSLVAAIDAHRSAVDAHESSKRAAEHAETVMQSYLSQASAAAAAADAARAKVETLEKATDEQHCETCGQTLADEARGRAIASYIEEARQHDQVARTHSSSAANVASVNVLPAPTDEPPVADLAAVRAQLAAAQQQAQQRVRLEERIRTLEQEITREPELAERIANATALAAAKQSALDTLAPVDLDEITRQGTAVRERLDANRGTLAQQRDLRARLDERLAQIAAAEDTLAAAAAGQAYIRDILDAVLVLERAFGRDGIPALIVENSAIPYLETEATQVLALLGGKTAAARVELRTQAELKSSDGLRDTLDIVVVTEHDSERSYENWSGGEQMRINLALRVALAKLLAHGGAASGIFVIDEPDGLDATGKAALIDILRDMQGRGIERVYLISHDADLRDSFDTTLSVVDGRVDSGLEAVPA